MNGRTRHRRREGALTAAILLGSLLAACEAPRSDAYVEAARVLDQGALHHALAELDAVAPEHPRYAEARALAQALERRLRAAQRLTLQGMRLRSEWRDEEAVAAFEDALAIWPGSDEATALLRATQQRLAAMQRQSAAAAGEGEALAMAPELVPEAPDAAAVPAAPGGGAAAPMGPAPSPLAGPRALLAEGEIEAAIEELVALREAAAAPAEALEAMLVQAWHQRALTRYGQGYLEAAIGDWERILETGRGDDVVRAFLLAARTELRLRRPAPSGRL